VDKAEQFTTGWDAESIDNELRQLWGSLGEAPKPQPLVRRSVVSVVAVVSDNRGAAAVTDMIPVLARQHPGRYIVVVLNAGKEMLGRRQALPVGCHLTVECSEQTCYELVVVPIVPGQAPKLPAMVRALLRFEVPTMLWWRYIFNPNEIFFNELAGVAQRIIVDSVSLQNPVKAFARIIDLNSRAKPNNLVFDINWERITPWRFAVAGLYDIPAYQPALSHLTHVEIEYGHQLSRQNFINNSQALFLFGWLASRLGWRPLAGVVQEQPEILYRIDMAGDGGRIICHFRIQQAASHREAGIKKITLTAQGPPPGRFAVALCDDGYHIKTQVTLPERKTVEKTSCLEIGGEVDLIGTGFGAGTPDQVYGQTLAYLEGTEGLWREDNDVLRQ
jgi:glucose-6-phosphate dehydrogenase assembly protein OpcA